VLLYVLRDVWVKGPGRQAMFPGSHYCSSFQTKEFHVDLAWKIESLERFNLKIFYKLVKD
jgi:hypothetical protein